MIRNPMRGLGHDLRSAWRTLCRSRSSAFVAIALIAVAIGMNTALFTLLDRIVLRKLALPEPDRLVHFNGKSESTREPVPVSILKLLRERRDLFSGVSGWLDQLLPVEIGSDTVGALVVRVEEQFYAVVRADAQIGRLLSPQDRGAVAVISDQFWKTRFGGDPAALGRSIRINDTVLTIVGVMPPDFSGMIANVSVDVAVPLPALKVSRLEPVARLQPGVTFEWARAQIQAMWPELLAETVPPRASIAEWRADVGSSVLVESASHGQSYWREEYERPVVLLFGVAAVALLVVCANLAGMLVARVTARRKEIAIRVALGAGRARVISLLLLESLLLALAGGILSILVARWASNVAATFVPIGNVPFDLGMNARSLVFAAGLSLCTAMLFGILPAVVASRAEVAHAINRGTRSRRIRQLLLAVQVTLSTVLLVTSLLFVTTVAELGAEPLGFRPERVLALVVQGKTGSSLDAGYFEELLRRLRGLPGVDFASIANELPMQFEHYGDTGELARANDGWVSAEAHCVFSDYFHTLGIPVLQGHVFETRESHAIVVSDSLARRLFGNGDPVGETVRQKWNNKVTAAKLSGVVGDVKYGSPREPAAPAYYMPCLNQWTPEDAGRNTMTIAIRGHGAGLERAARREIDALGRQYVFRSEPLTSLIDKRTVRERMFAVVTSVFGALTLALVGVGLYSLTKLFVESRTREIGIRLAIGAQKLDIAMLLWRDLLAILASGLGLGLICTAGTGKLVTSYLFGVRALDPAVLIVSAGFITLSATIAVLGPLRRAVRVQAADALRHE